MTDYSDEFVQLHKWFSHDGVELLVTQALDEWMDAARNSNHPGHLSLQTRTNKKTSFETAHLGQIVQDGIIRPIYETVASLRTEPQIKLNRLAYSGNNCIGTLFTPSAQRQGPQFVHPEIKGIAQKVALSLDDPYDFAQLTLFAADNTDRREIIDVGNYLWWKIGSPLTQVLRQTIALRADFLGLNSSDGGHGSYSSERLCANGFIDSWIDIGFNCPMSESGAIQRETDDNEIKSYDVTKIQFASERLIAAAFEGAFDAGMLTPLPKERKFSNDANDFGDLVQDYLFRNVSCSAEPLDVFYRGVIFPRVGAYMEPATYILVRPAQVALPTDFIDDIDMTKLANDVHRFVMSESEKWSVNMHANAYHNYGSGGSSMAFGTHQVRDPLVPSLQIWPYNFLGKYTDALCDRIADKKPESDIWEFF